MKTLLVLLVLGGGAYFGYQRFEAMNPEHIHDPVYAEIRVDAKIEGRELNLILFGEMAGDEDCRTRTDRVWRKVVECPACRLSSSKCQKELAPRYRKLFDDKAIPSTYLTFTRGSRYERDGRMVIYGLTADEGDAICESTKREFATRYEGEVKCIHALRL